MNNQVRPDKRFFHASETDILDGFHSKSGYVNLGFKDFSDAAMQLFKDRLMGTRDDGRLAA
jgi:hypothetical protein